jgi:hypothetical protein
VPSRGFDVLPAGGGELPAKFGLRVISVDWSGAAAEEVITKKDDVKITRQTNSVAGILLNIPFLPVQYIGYSGIKSHKKLSSKK